MVKGKEDCELLKTSLANVIEHVNSLCKEGTPDINGTKVKIELLLGGDYKVRFIFSLPE